MTQNVLECKENYYHLKFQHQISDSLAMKGNHSKFDRKGSIHNNYTNTNVNYNTFVVEMFMEVCKRLDKQSQDFLRKVIPIDESREFLLQTDLLIILNYFKQIVIFLVKTKLELEDKLGNNDNQGQYESLIQKLEADVRNHIRVEQQLRLYAETAQQKMDDLQNDKQILEDQNKELIQQLQQQNKEISSIQNQLNDCKRTGSYRNSNKSNKTITEPINQDQELNQQSYSHLLTDFSDQQQQKQNNQLQIQAAIRKHAFNKEIIKPVGDKSPKLHPIYLDQKKTKSQLNSLINSPEKVQRKFSQVTTAETKAIKQPTFLRQSVNQTNPYLRTDAFQQPSYRSNSQEPLQTYKKNKN